MHSGSSSRHTSGRPSSAKFVTTGMPTPMPRSVVALVYLGADCSNAAYALQRALSQFPAKGFAPR
jgi:hypothetical protein